MQEGSVNECTLVLYVSLVAVRIGQLAHVLEMMNEVKKITRRSHVVDLGSGDGEALAYISKRYGCNVTGIEYEEALVGMALETFAKNNLKKYRFVHGDFATLDSDWLVRIGATHVYAFDGVYGAEHWDELFHRVIAGGPKGLTGASCSRWSRYWPEGLEKQKGRGVAVGLTGSTSTFTFRVWKKRV